MKMAQPTIDDQFWFDYSKIEVNSSVSKIVDASKNLQTFILWLWSVYTVVAGAGTVILKAYSRGTIFLLVTPSAIMIVAYFLTFYAQMPTRLESDVRMPRDIERNYSKNLIRMGRRLNWAIIFSALSILSVTICLYIASEFNSASRDFNINVHAQKTTEGTRFYIDGNLPRGQEIQLKIQPILGNGILGKPVSFPITLAPEQRTVEVDTLQTSFASRRYLATAEWRQQDGLTEIIERQVSMDGGKE
jgi:hypothetical protein